MYLFVFIAVDKLIRNGTGFRVRANGAAAPGSTFLRVTIFESTIMCYEFFLCKIIFKKNYELLKKICNK